MKLKPLASNMTELVLDGVEILFSYQTPVACIKDNNQGSRTFLKTDKQWSQTTSRHISKWAALRGCVTSNDEDHTRPQEFFDNLIAGVK